jgi:polyisoprenoid-binding protein YceI
LPGSALVFFVASLLGQSQQFAVDAKASEVAFSLGDVLHSVHGVFLLKSGAVEFDPGTGKMSGSIVVAAGSGKSGGEARDKRMAKDILDAPHFADVTFEPQRYDGALSLVGDSTIQVAGIFTLHGTPHELTLPMKVHIEGAQCTAKGRFAVPYVKWGLKDPSTFVLRVSKEVEIDLTLTGTLQR